MTNDVYTDEAQNAQGDVRGIMTDGKTKAEYGASKDMIDAYAAIGRDLLKEIKEIASGEFHRSTNYIGT